jgi:hypothetical protein
MKKHLLVLLLSIFAITANLEAQSDSTNFSRNAVYVELFGSSIGVYNLSYDRILFRKGNYKVSVALGVQGLSDYYSMTPQINLIKGNENCFEMGLGYAMFSNYNNGAERAIISRFGYRYQSLGNRSFFKIGVTPFFFKDNMGSPIFMPWGGLAFGYSF